MVPATALTRDNTWVTVPPSRVVAGQVKLPTRPLVEHGSDEVYCTMTFTWLEGFDKNDCKSGEIFALLANASPANIGTSHTARYVPPRCLACQREKRMKLRGFIMANQ